MVDDAEAQVFREWLGHYEKERESDRKRINQLTDNIATINQSVGALTADVQTLINNQKGMFDRINRPTQWGVLVSAAAFVAIVLGLVIAPLKQDLELIRQYDRAETEHNLSQHIAFEVKTDDTNVLVTRNQVDLEWMAKMEERLYDHHVRQHPNTAGVGLE